MSPPLASPSPPVVSIVAKSKTGKTTLIEKLVPELYERGLSVGVVKHHGHRSSFDVPEKDTFRMAKAGADVVVGISPVQIAVFRARADHDTFEESILHHCAGVDLVLTEGYKQGPFPKIEVNRSSRSSELICDPGELIALVSDRDWDLPVRQFDLDDASAIADFLASWTTGKAIEEI